MLKDRIDIRSPFIQPGPDCECPEDCKDLCWRAFAMFQEAKYENNNPGSSALTYQLRTRKCRHPQALEMKALAEELLAAEVNP